MSKRPPPPFVRRHRWPDREIDNILIGVADHYGVAAGGLIGRYPQWRYALPRFVVYHLCRQLTTLSYTQIGLAFGRDHTTICSGHRKVRLLMDRDPTLAARVEDVAAAISRN